jgi:hypothetical protein
MTAFSQEKFVMKSVIHSAHHHAPVLQKAQRNATVRNLPGKVGRAINRVHNPQPRRFSDTARLFAHHRVFREMPRNGLFDISLHRAVCDGQVVLTAFERISRPLRVVKSRADHGAGSAHNLFGNARNFVECWHGAGSGRESNKSLKLT